MWGALKELNSLVVGSDGSDRARLPCAAGYLSSSLPAHLRAGTTTIVDPFCLTIMAWGCLELFSSTMQPKLLPGRRRDLVLLLYTQQNGCSKSACQRLWQRGQQSTSVQTVSAQLFKTCCLEEVLSWSAQSCQRNKVWFCKTAEIQDLS